MTISHLPKKFGIKKGAEEFPFMVVVSVTYVCNAKCPHCPYTNSDIRETYKDAPFIKPEIFKKIADECGKYHAYIRLTGGGEPLLHPQMLDLIDYAKKKKARIGLITNGSLLTPEKAERLLAAETDVIEFSVDAADKKTHSKIRVGLDFDEVKRNIFYLVKRRNELKSPTEIVVSVVEQKANINQLDKIVKYWGKIVDNVQVRKFLTWDILNEENAGDPTPYYKKRPPCPHPFERLNIDSRGKIMFCGFDIRGETDFGNVMKTSIKDVWTGKKFNEWRKLILKGEYDKISVCRKCQDWRYKSWTYNYWKVLRDAEKKRKKLEKLNKQKDN
jgi:radical SAM protein with 4Fe4S-binding SPASM domain